MSEPYGRACRAGHFDRLGVGADAQVTGSRRRPGDSAKMSANNDKDLPMPRAPLTPEALRLLALPNPAVIAVVRPDGQPVSVATWYLVDDDGRILINMDAERRRIAYMRENPRVSLTALGADDWGSHVSIQGQIVEWRDDEDLSDADRLADHYGEGTYTNRDRPRVTALIAISHWHTWGPGLPADQS